MTIFRVQHNRNYTTINNTNVKDVRLSWKAKGIWTYAFSRPDDWSFNEYNLIQQSTDGRESVRSGLRELERSGYLKRSQSRDKHSGQFIESEWMFYEVPQKDDPSPLPPTTENQTTVNDASDFHIKTPRENESPILSTDILNTELLNTYLSKQQQAPHHSFVAASSNSLMITPNKDATTKNFTETKKLPKAVVAAASNKQRENKRKDDESLTNNHINSLLEKTYGSMLGQSGEGPPPPVVPATPERASHGASKSYAVPSAVGMTITRKPDAVAPDGGAAEDKKILLEQLKDSLSKENLKLAEEYIDCFHEEVFNANSPPGIVIHAIKNDYAKGKIADAKQWKRDHKKPSTQQIGSDKDSQAAANRPYAQEMHDRLKEKYMHRIFDVYITSTHVGVSFLRKGKQHSHTVGFLENNFHGKIDALEKSCWNYIGWIKKDYGHKLKDYHDHAYLEQEIPI